MSSCLKKFSAQTLFPVFNQNSNDDAKKSENLNQTSFQPVMFLNIHEKKIIFTKMYH